MTKTYYRPSIRLVLIGFLFAALAGVSLSAESPESVLSLIKRADPAFAMKKSAVVWFGDKTEATVYWEYHLPPDLWRMEYLAPASAKGRVVIQRGSKMWQWEPQRKKVFLTIGGPVSEETELSQPLLRRNYHMEIISSDRREANHPCRVLKLTPRSHGKSRWMLWVDRETGVILKRERYGSTGVLELATGCTEFKPGQVNKELFDPTRLPHVQVVTRNISKATLSPALLVKLSGMKPPKELAGGFRLQSSALADHPGTVHTIYTDGLIMISLFASKGSKQAAVDQGKNRTLKIRNSEVLISSFGPYPSVSWSCRDFQYQLVGNVGERTLLAAAKQLLEL